MGVFNTISFRQKLGIFFISICCIISDADAQRFKGSAVFGLNLSQIDGDDLAGFSKLGLTGGVKLAYPIQEHSDMNIELLYSQRGSTSGFGFGSQNDIFTDLRYLEIPVYINIKDWFMAEGNYHKAKAHAGFSYAYLFDVESSNGAVSNDIDSYNRNNLGFLIGVDYSFTSHLGMTVRYTRAMNSLTEARAISYFVTVRTEYTF